MNAFTRAALSIPTNAHTPARSNHMAADAYTSVLFTSDDGRLRVITCCDQIQWIVQVRLPFTSKAHRPWKAIGFCTTKVGLRRVIRYRRTLPEMFTGSWYNCPNASRGCALKAAQGA